MTLKEGYAREAFVWALRQTIAMEAQWRKDAPVIKYVLAIMCDCGAILSFEVDAPKVHQFLEGAIDAADVITDEMDNCFRPFVMFHESSGGHVQKAVGVWIDEPEESCGNSRESN